MLVRLCMSVFPGLCDWFSNGLHRCVWVGGYVRVSVCLCRSVFAGCCVWFSNGLGLCVWVGGYVRVSVCMSGCVCLWVAGVRECGRVRYEISEVCLPLNGPGTISLK